MTGESFYSSPRWSNEIADCSMPMTFDTYSNCSYNCLYCFSQFQRNNGKKGVAYRAKIARPVNVEKVKRLFLDPTGSQFEPYIRARKVMQWGGLSDQFDGNERVNGKTLELLRFFKEIDYPLCFSTKATWWTQDERYMELFRGQKNWNVKISIITLDERKAAIVERGVPTPRDRLDAIGRIAEAGCGGATLRLRPFIIGITTPTYLDLIQAAADKGATAMSTEFLCVDIMSRSLKPKLPIFDALCGFDMMQFYKKYSTQNGYLRLNRNIKRPFIEKMKAKADECGLRFYVSDAHFKEYCCNGSCCGLPPDWNYSRGQFCEALQIAKRNGVVRWADIKADVEALHGGYMFRKAENFNARTSEIRARFYTESMADYIRWLWNNPQAGQSPYKMFEGIVRPAGKDEEGNIVYAYAGPTVQNPSKN